MVKDESFFINHADEIFSEINQISPGSISAFKKLFELKDNKGVFIIQKEDRESIWQYFETFIRISIHYIHEQRSPSFGEPILKEIIKEDGSKIVKKTPTYMYNKRFFMGDDEKQPNIDLSKYAKEWGVSLWKEK